MKTENSKHDAFRHEFYAEALRNEGENKELNGKLLKANLFFNAAYQVISWDVLPQWRGWYIIFGKEFIMLNPAWKKRLCHGRDGSIIIPSPMHIR